MMIFLLNSILFLLSDASLVLIDRARRKIDDEISAHDAATMSGSINPIWWWLGCGLLFAFILCCCVSCVRKRQRKHLRFGGNPNTSKALAKIMRRVCSQVGEKREAALKDLFALAIECQDSDDWVHCECFEDVFMAELHEVFKQSDPVLQQPSAFAQFIKLLVLDQASDSILRTAAIEIISMNCDFLESEPVNVIGNLFIVLEREMDASISRRWNAVDAFVDVLRTDRATTLPDASSIITRMIKYAPCNEDRERIGRCSLSALETIAILYPQVLIPHKDAAMAMCNELVVANEREFDCVTHIKSCLIEHSQFAHYVQQYLNTIPSGI